MPSAKVYVPAGTLTPEQRRDIVQGIHDVINTVEKRPATATTYVMIAEVPTGSWGYSGAVYTPKR